MNAPVDLLAVARDLYAEAGLPTNVHIDLTYRCDLDCVHCYLDNKRDWPELTTAEAENVLDQLRAMQVMELTWSGGEIFARPDFLPLLARASRMGFRNIVKTHGGSLTPERCAALADAYVMYLSVSLYSLDPEIHDGITTKPGSLQATLDGLQNARAAGLTVQISFVVMEYNAHEIDRVDTYARDNGFIIRMSAGIIRDHTGSDALDDLNIDEETSIAVRRRALQIGREQGQRFHRQTDEEWSGSTTCTAGRTYAYISPDGDVWPCVSWPMSLGNLREQTFEEIWLGSELRKQIVAWRNEQRTSCASCSGRSLCSYCPGEAYKHTGDFRKAPEKFHQQTREMVVAMAEVYPELYQPEDLDGVAADIDQAEQAPLPLLPPPHRPKKRGGKRVAGVALGQTSLGRKAADRSARDEASKAIARDAARLRPIRVAASGETSAD